jgi:hypothetical protein
MQALPSDPSRVTPRPAHASSAIACNVRRASHIRQSCPSASSSRDVSARSRETLHSSAKRPGNRTFLSSTHTLHCRPASSSLSAHRGKRWGGHTVPGGGANTNRYASDRSRITYVRANRSAGQFRNSSVIALPARACHKDAGVSCSLSEFRINTSCSRYGIGVP